ncbi:MAG: metallothionein [Myxococcota bacterium]|nr:metallothionein [Myxococcota bacterium]
MVRKLVASGMLFGLVLFAAPSSALACEHAPKTVEKPAPPAASDPTREVKGTLLGEIDVLVADKCSCQSAADCTCKKGQCKCKACKHKRMIQPVKGTTDALQLPKEARWEATSGVFI